MLLILTHENADFDAVASLLAAGKLYPEGVALLPWRINRNVSQFLNLYWEAFGFLRSDDWRRQRVDEILLVDTHSLPSVRGVRPDRVQVQVIDHHETAESRSGWQIHSEPVGATTTILVEMLRSAGLRLTANEATLLLLGIHEDTGSLLYDTTTPRDGQAAAWLLQEGAQLSTVRRFLNIPLSEAQQALFEELLAAVEWIRVEGQSVALSQVVAPNDFDDEVSALAHFMRDTLSPHALLILVQLKHGHVQLVARSTSDHVDVSVIARALGGGGHSRAAAATIMDRPMAEVHQEIIDLLPQAASPAAKVAQIMSYRVQTLPATATVGEAARRMQRYGHEGYPIVDSESGELVGLLTRRAVDRAMSHQLENTVVSQIMRAGRVAVRPSDSVEHVQRLMIHEGWGQIPVLGEEAENGEEDALIGIVTRTDIINLVGETERDQDDANIRRLMVRSLSPAMWQMVQVISVQADRLEMPLYFVGGLVRDMLLDKPAVDIDMVVEGDAMGLARGLQEQYGGEVHTHARFGTAKWLLSSAAWQQATDQMAEEGQPGAIDFVTARTEFYDRPSALPEVEQGSIKLDLHRRDFTINTLAIRLDGAFLGQLLDFYGGQRDLEQGWIRVLHSLSFIDDPTRILRAVRLEQRLGFTIEARTAELMASALPMLDRVTGERIRSEIELALSEGAPIPIMARLAELGVMAQIHPGLRWQPSTATNFERLQNLLAADHWPEILEDQDREFLYFVLWLMPLSAQIQGEVMDRLRVRRTTRDGVEAVSRLLQEIGRLPQDAPASQIAAALRPYSARVLFAALAALGPDSAAGRQIDHYWQRLRLVRTVVDGHDLLAMGLKPGPQIGRLLDRLLAARLDGNVADEAGEQALIQRWLRETDETAER